MSEEVKDMSLDAEIDWKQTHLFDRSHYGKFVHTESIYIEDFRSMFVDRQRKHRYDNILEICDNNIKNAKYIDVGCMNVQCQYCKADMFLEERTALSSTLNPKFSMCCLKGQVKLPDESEPPQLIARLLCKYDSYSKLFLQYIRTFNNIFAFASFGTTVKLHPSVSNLAPGPWHFGIGGVPYHRTPSLRPDKNDHRFAQIYFLDPADSIQLRLKYSNWTSAEEQNSKQRERKELRMKEEIVEKLESMMRDVNPYVSIYKRAKELIAPDSEGEIVIKDRAPVGEHQRRYNAPTTDDIAVIVPETPESDRPVHRDIVIRNKTDEATFINETHRMYDPLTYALLFPHGTVGWDIHMKRYTFMTQRESNACVRRFLHLKRDRLRLNAKINNYLQNRNDSNENDSDIDIEMNANSNDNENVANDNENVPNRFVCKWIFFVLYYFFENYVIQMIDQVQILLFCKRIPCFKEKLEKLLATFQTRD